MRIGRNRNRKRERERRASGKLGRNQGKGLCVVCIRNKRHYTRGRCFNQFRSHEFPAELFKTLKRATVRDTRYLSCILVRIENIRMILLLLYVNYERNRFKVVSAITLLIIIITYLVKLDFISSQINRLSKLSIHCPNIFEISSEFLKFRENRVERLPFVKNFQFTAVISRNSKSWKLLTFVARRKFSHL